MQESGAENPIVVTKFQSEDWRCGCADYVEGFFARSKGSFVFKVYLDSVPSEETYPGTRLLEIYIEDESGTPQWSWHDTNRKALGWAHGEVLMQDLLIGLEEAIKNRIGDSLSYCRSRAACLIDQLVQRGFERSVVAAAFREAAGTIQPG